MVAIKKSVDTEKEGRGLKRRTEELLEEENTRQQHLSLLLQDLQERQDRLEHKNEDLQAEQVALHRSNDIYSDLFDFAPVAYMNLDMGGNIHTINMTAAHLLAEKPETLIGRNITSFIEPADQDIYYYHSRKLLGSRSPQHCDLRLKRGGGTTFYARLESTLYHERQSNLTQMRLAVIDISEEMEAKQQLLEARNRAEEANRAKSDFLANMSHEIRTPLNAVVGLIAILRSGRYDNAKFDHYLGTMNDSAQALLAIINDMLDFAKIESGRMELMQKRFNLRSLLKRCLAMMEVRALEKGLALEMAYPSELPTMYVGDRSRIRQVVINLLSNAVKFTERGSVRLMVDGKPAGQSRMKVHIKVSDTGIGIPAEHQQDIFNKFTQQDSSITRKYGGTGLGLAICRSLAELMEGKVAVESQLGKGSLFSLEVPLRLARRKAQAAPKKPQALPKPADFTLLVVEDHQPNVLIATLMLDDLGYRYEVARSGNEALQKFSERRYSLILMDIQMPGGDGLQATRAIRQMEKEEGRDPVAIIAMTAHALCGDKEKCLEAGMDDYIAKPIDLEMLRHKLAEYGGRKTEREREMARQIDWLECKPCASVTSAVAPAAAAPGRNSRR